MRRPTPKTSPTATLVPPSFLPMLVMRLIMQRLQKRHQWPAKSMKCLQSERFRKSPPIHTTSLVREYLRKAPLNYQTTPSSLLTRIAAYPHRLPI
jgi:hypothetical protein